MNIDARWAAWSDADKERFRACYEKKISGLFWRSALRLENRRKIKKSRRQPRIALLMIDNALQQWQSSRQILSPRSWVPRPRNARGNR